MCISNPTDAEKFVPFLQKLIGIQKFDEDEEEKLKKELKLTLTSDSPLFDYINETKNINTVPWYKCLYNGNISMQRDELNNTGYVNKIIIPTSYRKPHKTGCYYFGSAVQRHQEREFQSVRKSNNNWRHR